MILTAFDVYLVGLMDSLSIGLFVIAIILIVVGFFGFHFAMKATTQEEIDENFSSNSMLITTLVGALLLFINIFIPSSKTLASMYILPPMVNAVTQNKELQQIPPKLLGLANDWIDALKPEVKK